MKEPFEDFIKRFKDGLRELFHDEHDLDELSLDRGLPENIWKGIMDYNPLSVAIPEAYGGRGAEVKECLGILSAASYESLPLSLTFGINIALFLEPLAKYGHDDIKAPIFDRFLKHQAMGGLMITEPDYGSDALNMQTAYIEDENGFRIRGKKHWQGLTGMADFWIIAARKKMPDGNLARDVEFFVSDERNEGQKILVEKYYKNLGLYMIPYGLNKLDLLIPRNQKLQQPRTGIKLMLDVLHRSRLQFPGMGMGFIRRMLDEASAQCDQRLVAGRKLAEMDSVRFQLSRLQSAYSLCSGMCARSVEISGIEHDVSTQGLEANTMKALVTDLMQESAQICVQLHGSRGYKLDHVAGRGIIDSRPFQIFEGSNEMLYTQITEGVVKAMKKGKESNLKDFLSGMDLTDRVAPLFEDLLNFALPESLPQRQMVILGKLIARLVCLQYVQSMTDRGFRRELFDNCIKHIKLDASRLLAEFTQENDAEPVPDYAVDSDWMDYI